MESEENDIPNASKPLKSEDESKTSGKGPVKSDDPDIYRLLRNISVIATIIATVAGVAFSAYQLELKGESDAQVARLNELAEWDKVMLAKDQLSDQARARKDQEYLELKKLELQNSAISDLANANDKRAKESLAIQYERSKQDAADTYERSQHQLRLQDEKARSEKLAALVSHLFGSSTASEGDLATLFEFLDEGNTNIQTIKNAVLARLENPRSREEIDLGFRLLERIGPDAIDVTVQCNRSARRRYDDYIFGTLQSRLMSSTKEKSFSEAFGFSKPQVYRIEDDLSRDTRLSKSYVIATINYRYRHGIYAPDSRNLPSQSSQFSVREAAIEVIQRSNEAFRVQIRALKHPDPKTLYDFTGMYFTEDQIAWWAEDKFSGSYNMKDSYIETDSLVASFSGRRDIKDDVLKPFSGAVTSSNPYPGEESMDDIGFLSPFSIRAAIISYDEKK